MAKLSYRWGIIGAGNIAASFVKGLNVLSNARLYAVASRDGAKASSFADEYGFECSYGSYQNMLDDPKVDVVYVATPNHLHYEHTMMALRSGKAVLCEKPFAVNCLQAKEMIDMSRSKGLFLMEALWSRFLPSVIEVKRLVESGKIGNPMFLQAEFGIHPAYNPASRLFNPELGGGSIPDIGIYPLFLALYLFGNPISVNVSSVPAPTGVDMTTSVVMRHRGGQMSVLTSSFAFDLTSDAKVTGDKGTLRLDRMFHMPTKLFFRPSIQEEEILIPIDIIGNGYNYEAAEVMRCMDEGLTESGLWSHSDTLNLLRLVERVVNEAYSEN